MFNKLTSALLTFAISQFYFCTIQNLNYFEFQKFLTHNLKAIAKDKNVKIAVAKVPHQFVWST
jgi:hypothetical protein